MQKIQHLFRAYCRNHRDTCFRSGHGSAGAFACISSSLLTIAPAPASGWTGFYIGANGGYGLDGDPTVSFTPNDGAANDVTCANAFGLGTTCIPPASFATRGGLGGIQVGYNWQPGRSWVVGVKSDFDWSRITGTGTSKFALPVGANLEPQTPTRRKRSNGSAPLRARLGWLATDNLLLYARSHLTVGQSARAVHRTIDNGANHGNAPFLPAPIASSATPLRRYGVGTAGFGGEFAISSNVSLFADCDRFA